jgi:hypothetical protein
MAANQMTVIGRQRIARDTMVCWFDTNGASFEFQAGQHADFILSHPCIGTESDNSRTFSIASSPHDKSSVMIAMYTRKTAVCSAIQAAALGAPSSAVLGAHSRCIEISSDLRCFWPAESGSRRFAASFSGLPRNGCRIECICFIQTGRPATQHSSKNLKV